MLCSCSECSTEACLPPSSVCTDFREKPFPSKVFKSQNCCSPATPACWSGPSVVTVAEGDCLTSALEQRWTGFVVDVSKWQIHFSHPSGKLHIALVLCVLRSGCHSNNRMRKLRFFTGSKRMVMENLVPCWNGYPCSKPEWNLNVFFRVLKFLDHFFHFNLWLGIESERPRYLTISSSIWSCEQN